jgi:hypothetical protein
MFSKIAERRQKMRKSFILQLFTNMLYINTSEFSGLYIKAATTCAKQAKDKRRETETYEYRAGFKANRLNTLEKAVGADIADSTAGGRRLLVIQMAYTEKVFSVGFDVCL